jgi:hypothetical protein
VPSSVVGTYAIAQSPEHFQFKQDMPKRSESDIWKATAVGDASLPYYTSYLLTYSVAQAAVNTVS